MTFTHTQATPSTTWTIVHGQGGYPVVDAYISNNGVVQKILPLGVEYVDQHTVALQFNVAHSGFATVVV